MSCSSHILCQIVPPQHAICSSKPSAHEPMNWWCFSNSSLKVKSLSSWWSCSLVIVHPVAPLSLVEWLFCTMLTLWKLYSTKFSIMMLFRMIQMAINCLNWIKYQRWVPLSKIWNCFTNMPNDCSMSLQQATYNLAKARSLAFASTNTVFSILAVSG